jgi:DNA-binding NarL/FixJ family response regulator
MSGDRKIVAPGSSGVRLTQREEQIARLLSLGYQHKKIAHIIGISANTVSVHVSNMASRIPGDGNPSVKVTVWYLEYHA